MPASVLIVHPESMSAEQFKSVVEDLDLKAFVSSCPESASQSIRILRPDLILLDGRLVLENLSLGRILRQSCPEKRLPIILLIPQDADDIGRYLCGTEVDDYICQPYSINEIQARLMLRLSMSEKRAPRPMPQVDFAFLNNLSNLVVSELSSSEILQRVVNSISDVIDVDRCSVTMVREGRGSAYVMASSDDIGVNGLQIDLDRYPEIQETIKTGKPLLIADVFKHPLMEGVRPYLENLQFNSILVLPMVDSDRTIGVLVLRSARSIAGFTEDEIFFCQLVANVTSSALRLAEIRKNEIKIRERGLHLKASGTETISVSERSSLLNMAAHDLRVLVSIIDGYCLLLNETGNGNLNPEQNEIIGGLMAGNRRLVDMANDLLDFSQLNSGRFELNFAERDVCQILGSVYGDLLPILQRRKISFQADCLNNVVPVVCDEHGIRRVFYNIVSNALKFTPDGGLINLDVSVADGETRITVEDNGPGIEPEQISNLFDEFASADFSDPRSGNGLGLSICKKIIEAHQGRIWAESSLGQGSRFTFCLPQ
jgi:signal transduction histidine kinase/DNA-binding response OmpR family regulator